MDDARRSGGGSDDERDELDRLIDGALDRMKGGGQPIDVRAGVLARLDESGGAAPAPWAAWVAWRPAAALGAVALVVLLAAVTVSRLTVDRGGSAADPRSMAAHTEPADSAPGPAREVATLVQAEPSRTDATPPVGRRRPATGAGEDASIGSTEDMTESEHEPAEALARAGLTLPGAPAGNPGEPIPALPAPPPVVIPAIAPAPIVVVPSVGDLGRPLGNLPIADPARVIANIEKSGGTSP